MEVPVCSVVNIKQIEKWVSSFWYAAMTTGQRAHIA